MIMKAEYFLFLFLLFPAGKANFFSTFEEVENKKVVLQPDLHPLMFSKSKGKIEKY